MSKRRSRERRAGRELTLFGGEQTQKSFPTTELAMGGGLEGAERTSREMALWRPSFGSPDQAISMGKELADARGRDTVLNDAYAMGAMQFHKDAIVGSYFRLNATPDWEVLRDIHNPANASPTAWQEWAEAYQVRVERRFSLTAESSNHWLDSSRRMTLTEMIRLQVGSFVYTGEVLESGEWIRQAGRPCATAVTMINPDRLSNPNGLSDSPKLVRGIEMGFWGEHKRYWIQQAHPGDFGTVDALKWVPVEAEKPWGRKQIIYINEPIVVEQTRGISSMVSALKHINMTKQFSEITLQNAVINASYAASVESELPSADIIAAMGGGNEDPLGTYLNKYMTMLSEYMGGSNNIRIDGATIPQFFPGTKLNTRPLGTPGGIGTGYEESLLRRVAAGLNVNYSALSKDYSKASFSGLKAEIGDTEKFLNSRKKSVADKAASYKFELWLEEELAGPYGMLPPGWKRDDFYRPLAKEALSKCKWVGTGRGMIDELNETQAAILRIKAGLSTREIEIAKLGNDFREVLAQLEREDKLIAKHGLTLDLNAQQSQSGASTQQNLQGGNADDKDAADKKKAKEDA